jgi:hypothetical protein
VDKRYDVQVFQELSAYKSKMLSNINKNNSKKRVWLIKHILVNQVRYLSFVEKGQD